MGVVPERNTCRASSGGKRKGKENKRYGGPEEMTKTGLTDLEWKGRLGSFAGGKFQFGRGQRPPKKLMRALQLQAVESCPKHRNSQKLESLGGC